MAVAAIRLCSVINPKGQKQHEGYNKGGLL